MVKLRVLFSVPYGHPKDPAAFEEYCAETHLPIAQTMKAANRIE